MSLQVSCRSHITVHRDDVMDRFYCSSTESALVICGCFMDSSLDVSSGDCLFLDRADD